MLLKNTKALLLQVLNDIRVCGNGGKRLIMAKTNE